MAQTVCVLVSTSDRRRLEAITSDRNRQRKHIERAEVVLVSVGGGPVQQIATRVRRQPADGLALAAAFRRRGSGQPGARQDAQTWQAADRGGDGGARGRP